MTKLRFFTTLFLFVLLFSIPLTALYAQTPSDIDAMARDAVRRLEAALGGGTSNPFNDNPVNIPGNVSSGGVSSGSQNTQQQPAPAPAPQVQVTRGGRQPNWVTDPYAAYNRNFFVAAIGMGPDRNQAEARALASLISIFGQSVRSDFTVTTNYTEALNRGVVSVSQNNNIRDQIATAASMDKLIGAQIGNVWDSGRGSVYAVAYMDRARTIAIYTDMIIVNNRNIEMLTTMTNAEKNTLDGFARFRLAAQIAGINENYSALVSQMGGSTASLNLRDPGSLNLEATNIIRNVTVLVRVTNDRANRVQDAFARVLAAEGLRTRGTNPLYTLDVRISLSERTFPNNPMIWCQYEVSANLIENSTGASLLPFSFSNRAGNPNYEGAVVRAFIDIETEIAQRYSAALSGYLASLIPLR